MGLIFIFDYQTFLMIFIFTNIEMTEMKSIDHMIEALKTIDVSSLDEDNSKKLLRISNIIDELVYNKFVQLKNFPDGYRISIEYPHTLLKPNDSVMVENQRPNGYIRIKYKNQTLYKHKVIAEQFIENPNNFHNVILVNGDKTDNHISNLRWSYNKRTQ
jgi:hypothetical protein